ncbi:MAG: glycosyltransferase family 2 protein [Gemmatimonadetes bacterium]|nr:glycosyltransferase family 2 protein [Gemmatimonadota bacterium]
MPAEAARSARSPAPALSLVIPAYNEAARLAPTLRDSLAWLRKRDGGFEIIVVDDGSTDGTSELVQREAERSAEVRLIRLPANHGKGFAVRTGMLNAGGARVLFADADGATPIAELPRLEDAIGQGADVAIGSRALQDREVRVDARFHRRLMGRTFHRLVSLLTVKGFHDTQCGFKMFRGDVAHDLFSRMRMNGFSFDVELLLMARRRGYAVREVPVNWTHQPGSRINLVTDSLRMALDLFVIRSHLVRGHYDQPRLARMHTGSSVDERAVTSG